MMKLSAKVIFTPKAYYKLASRGIEHLWGVLKILFCRENTYLDNDKRVNSLKPRIKRIITYIPIEMYQKYSRHAREYKIFFAALLSNNDTNKVDLKLQYIEKMK